MNINLINGDLDFDTHIGDFVIERDYINKIDRRREILKNIIRERLKTNFDDIYNYPEYGANIQQFIGQGLDNNLKEKIKNQTITALTYDNLLGVGDIETHLSILENILYFRMFIINIFEEPLSIGFTYNINGEYTIDY